MNDFNKILIANRGEIAVRIIKTARAMGYQTVAVYSDADASALHVKLADEAVHIGPSPVNESYLCPDKLIAAANTALANAIHPGYGFLSENSAFAKRCEENQITFIGPPSTAIELMGSKRQSKLAVETINVPTVPGYDGKDQSLQSLMQHAQQIGTPLMIKASAGGGGRGMRLVNDLSVIKQDLISAKSEAENAFGCGELILEKAIQNPRHIEIQIFADQHGHVIYLGERDCSVQRRHQKVVEEAPSPFVDDALRKSMGEAAIAVAKLCQYVGAGTVEFLVDKSGQFYFLEMNTRLQVEHPVTEMITGLDLVEWQLKVAAGEPLPLRQDQVQLSGHAIEVRLYAEDAYQNYLPQTGPIHLFFHDTLPGTRVDSGVETGSEINPFYDPMLAKIISHAADRSTAIRKLDQALRNTVLLGTQTNKAFLRQLINHPEFKQGTATTGFINQHQAHWQGPSTEATHIAAALAAALLHSNNATNNSALSSLGSNYSLSQSNSVLHCHVQRFNNSRHQVTLNGKSYSLGIEPPPQNAAATLHNPIAYHYLGVRKKAWFVEHDGAISIDTGEQVFMFSNTTHQTSEKVHQKGSGKIVAPMDGNLISVHVETGQMVKQGDVVAILEAMKMEHQLKADITGKVTSIDVKPGSQLKARQFILLIQEENNDNS